MPVHSRCLLYIKCILQKLFFFNSDLFYFYCTLYLNGVVEIISERRCEQPETHCDFLYLIYLIAE